jgi:hypothetical protein
MFNIRNSQQPELELEQELIQLKREWAKTLCMRGEIEDSTI